MARIEAGPKGGVVSFHNDDFANPAGLIDWLAAHSGTAKLRPDHKLVFKRDWEDLEPRLEGVRYLAGELKRLAELARGNSAAVA